MTAGGTSVARRVGLRLSALAALAAALAGVALARPARAERGTSSGAPPIVEKRTDKKKEPPKPVRMTMASTAERIPLPPLRGPI